MAERRAKPRIPLNNEGQIVIGDSRNPCLVLNIGARGAAIVCQNEQKVGDRIQLDIFLPNGTGWISVIAILTRVDRRKGENVWGLRFDHPDNPTQSRIDLFMRERLTAAAREKLAGKAGPAKPPEKRPDPRASKKPEEKEESTGEIPALTERDKDLRKLYKAAIKDVEGK